MEIEGRPVRAPADPPLNVSTVTVSPAILRSRRMRRCAEGGHFTNATVRLARRAVIINERMAAQFFPGEDPLGKRLRFKPQAGRLESAGTGMAHDCRRQPDDPTGFDNVGRRTERGCLPDLSTGSSKLASHSWSEVSSHRHQ